MKILIAEDNKNKLTSVISVATRAGVHDQDIDVVETPSEAISLIRKNHFDFFILDMSLPTYINESHSINSLSGKKILQTMKHKKIAIPTVVLTQWDVFGHHDEALPLEKLSSDLLKEFEGILHNVILWDPSDSKWEQEIIDFIGNGEK
ncbi:hypothetical protein [Aeromonas dhakensis]|uniref:hypothetical protein n=1 Tax=Aeromonas dhakensis TaxID=196024 RepID=UPI003F78CF10